MFLKKISLFFVFFCCSGVVFSGENRVHEAERLALAKEINQIFIQGGVCRSIQDCQENQFSFVSPAVRGVNVKTYSVVDQNILRKVVLVSANLFYSSSINEIRVENYRVTKRTELESSFFNPIQPSEVVYFKRGF